MPRHVILDFWSCFNLNVFSLKDPDQSPSVKTISLWGPQSSGCLICIQMQSLCSGWMKWTTSSRKRPCFKWTKVRRWVSLLCLWVHISQLSSLWVFLTMTHLQYCALCHHTSHIKVNLSRFTHIHCMELHSQHSRCTHPANEWHEGCIFFLMLKGYITANKHQVFLCQDLDLPILL